MRLSRSDQVARRAKRGALRSKVARGRARTSTVGVFPKPRRGRKGSAAQSKIGEPPTIRTLDKGKGMHDPDKPGVAEWLLANYKIHD